MKQILTSRNSTAIFFPDSVRNSSFKYLIMTCTVFADCGPPEFINETTGLRPYSFYHSYIRNGKIANDEIY